MQAKVRSGPEPMRLRLDNLVAPEFAHGLQLLIDRAQRGQGEVSVSPQRLIEAVQVAYDAMRARERLTCGEPIPLRWLGALANVATSHIRNLVRAGALTRTQGGIVAESARRWLERPKKRDVRRRRLVAVEPSWWNRCPNKLMAFFSGLQQVGQEVLPPTLEIQLDIANTPCFEVAAGSPLEDEEVEFLRARVREALEPFEDPKSWPRPLPR